MIQWRVPLACGECCVQPPHQPGRQGDVLVLLNFGDSVRHKLSPEIRSTRYSGSRVEPRCVKVSG